jgi:outer membrane protein insertion porin family
MKKGFGNCLLLTLTVSLVFFNVRFSPAFAYDDEDEEQGSEFTQADKIIPNQLKELDNRTYDEGITVKEIDITGNNLVKAEDILKQMNTKVGEKFDRDAIQKDLKTIYEMGYFTERIKAVPQSGPNGIKLRIQVEENAPVTGFSITGNKAVNTEDISKIFEGQTGLPQNISELNKAVEKIESLYAEKGYILARVKKIADDPDGMINIDVNEGMIDQIKISGNTKTKDFVIKRNMATAAGTIYNENLLKQDLTRIFGSQSFSDVRRVLTASPNDPDKYLLTIEVDEKRTGAISLGGGIDTSTGLFGTVGYTDNNFRGLGQELSLNFMTGSGVVLRDKDTVRRAPLQFEAKFLEPRLKQTMNSLEVTGFAREYASYQVPLAIERRFGGEVEFARPIKKIPHLAGSVSMGFENVKIKEGDEDEILQRYDDYTDFNPTESRAERKKQLKGGSYISMGPSLVYDTRNSILNSRSGWYASTSLKESIGLSGGSYGKLSGSVKKFLPIGKQSSVLFGVKGGSQLIGTMPEFAAFRLGGSDSVRGFREGDVGNGKAFLMATTEFRTPIPFIDKMTKINFVKDMRVAFFADAGSLFRETITNDLYNRPGYGISAGMGLRVNIPGLGPLNVDYGYPLTSVGTGNKKGGRFTFGFGQ